MTKLYYKVTDENREDFVFGLVVGLVVGGVFGGVVGLVVGGVFGVVFGGVVGLVVGGVFGGVVGLVVGLVFGLVVGGVVGLVFGLVELIDTIPQLFFILLLIIIISEILYWVDKHHWKGMSRWENTILKKLECMFETSIIIVNIRNVVVHYQDVIVFVEGQTEAIHRVFSIVGYGTIIALGVVVWFWLNSFKYKNKER